MSGLHVWGPREATFPGSRGCPLHAAGPGCFQVGGLGCRRGNGPGKVKRPYAESLGWVVVRAGIVTQADLILISVPRGAFLSAPTPKGLLSRPTPCVVLPALPRALERWSLFDAAHFARWVSGQLGLRGWAPPGLEQRGRDALAEPSSKPAPGSSCALAVGPGQALHLPETVLTGPWSRVLASLGSAIRGQTSGCCEESLGLSRKGFSRRLEPSPWAASPGRLPLVCFSFQLVQSQASSTASPSIL